MKKNFQVSLLILCVILSSCHKKEDPIKIGVSLCNSNDTFMTYLKDAMVHKSKEYKNIEVLYADGKDNILEQIAQVDQFIAQKVDSLIICPVNTVSDQGKVTLMTKKIQSAGIHLVYINRRPDYLPNGVYFIGSDDKKAGRMQADYIASQIEKKGNVGLLTGNSQLPNVKERLEGFKEQLNKYPDIKVVREESGEWIREKGMDVVERWIASKIELDAIISHNDDMAMGAVVALEAENLDDYVFVMGFDAIPESLEFIEDGRLDATVLQNSEQQGFKSIDAAYSLARKKTVNKIQLIPLRLVTLENYDKLTSE